METRPKQQGKSLAQRTREELVFSDGEEEDEVLLAHREEMVQFMIDVHRRRKRVIEAYEKKEAVKTHTHTNFVLYFLHTHLNPIL